jgi:hypothetical protein
MFKTAEINLFRLFYGTDILNNRTGKIWQRLNKRRI